MSRKTIRIGLLAFLGALCLTGCLGVPQGVTPLRNFDTARYMGTWYEIARFDYRFERGMDNVTATYSLNPDGTVRVLNKGIKAGEAKSIEGSARPIGEPGQASLGVTFFKPFSAAYHVIWIDAEYQNAVVCGSSHKYLWLLSRNAHPSQAQIDQMKAFANVHGFDTEKLIMVKHNR